MKYYLLEIKKGKYLIVQFRSLSLGSGAWQPE